MVISRKPGLVYSFLVLALVLYFQRCEASGTFHIEEKYWLADIGVNGRYVSPFIQKGYLDLDVKKDLGFQNNNISMYRLSWSLDDNRAIWFDSFDTQYHGNGFIKEYILFNQIYPKEVSCWSVETLHLEYQKIAWVRYGERHPNDKWKTAYLVDIKRAAMRGQVDGYLSANNVSHPFPFTGRDSWHITVPTVGFVLSYSPNKNCVFNLEASGLTTGSRGFSFLDLATDMEFFLGPKKDASIVVGYRMIDYKNMRETDKTKLKEFKIAGSFFGVKVKI